MYIKWKTKQIRKLAKSHLYLEISKILGENPYIYESVHYAYLVESYRDKNSKVRQKTIAYLGSTSKPSALSKKTNNIFNELKGLGKQNKIKLLKRITEKCNSLKINREKCELY